jgi:hypothetical protein
MLVKNIFESTDAIKILDILQQGRGCVVKEANLVSADSNDTSQISVTSSFPLDAFNEAAAAVLMTMLAAARSLAETNKTQRLFCIIRFTLVEEQVFSFHKCSSECSL